jgi:DNA-binding MarR family transcriptional regulator
MLDHMHLESDSSARPIQEAFTQLMRWAQRGDVRRALLDGSTEALSTNDIVLLRAITTHGPVRASDLAHWQGVDKSTVTPQVRRLSERGLVTRQGDPGDRRAALLTLTEHGRQRLEQIDEAGTNLFERALDGWPPDDRRALATLMQRFVDGLADVPQANLLASRPQGDGRSAGH